MTKITIINSGGIANKAFVVKPISDSPITCNTENNPDKLHVNQSTRLSTELEKGISFCKKASIYIRILFFLGFFTVAVYSIIFIAHCPDDTATHNSTDNSSRFIHSIEWRRRIIA